MVKKKNPEEGNTSVDSVGVLQVNYKDTEEARHALYKIFEDFSIGRKKGSSSVSFKYITHGELLQKIKEKLSGTDFYIDTKPFSVAVLHEKLGVVNEVNINPSFYQQEKDGFITMGSGGMQIGQKVSAVLSFALKDCLRLLFQIPIEDEEDLVERAKSKEKKRRVGFLDMLMSIYERRKDVDESNSLMEIERVKKLVADDVLLNNEERELVLGKCDDLRNKISKEAVTGDEVGVVEKNDK